MIEYCLAIFMNCKTPECFKKLEHREELVMPSHGGSGNSFNIKPSILSVINKSFKSEKECELFFTRAKKPLNYSHACFTQLKSKNSNGCLGYEYNGEVWRINSGTNFSTGDVGMHGGTSNISRGPLAIYYIP